MRVSEGAARKQKRVAGNDPQSLLSRKIDLTQHLFLIHRPHSPHPSIPFLGMKPLLCSVLLCLATSVVCGQKFEGLAPTPPMGWNTWNTFAGNINEALIKETADALVA